MLGFGKRQTRPGLMLIEASAASEAGMNPLPFKHLPLIVKIAAGIAFFNSWVLFEEIVVDRQGLWRYMPFYRVGDFCVWDLTVALLILFGLWRLSYRGTHG
jgi:hypothetical protein